MIRRPPRSTRTDTLFPYTTPFLSEILLVDTPDRAPLVAAVVSLDEKIGDGRGAARLDRRHGETGGGGESHREGFRFDAVREAGHGGLDDVGGGLPRRSEEHTSELQSLMRISSAVFCLKKTIE